jgi:hypothetical protein
MLYHMPGRPRHKAKNRLTKGDEAITLAAYACLAIVVAGERRDHGSVGGGGTR